MAWIKTIPEDQAQGPLAELYAGIRATFGLVPNIMKASGSRPSAAALSGRPGTERSKMWR